MPESRSKDLQLVLQEQNLWRSQGRVPGALAPPVERPLARHLWQRLLADEPHRYQLILGPRRVGKTTVLYQTVARLLAAGVDSSRIWWMRLDHPVLLREELGDLVRLAVDSSGASTARPVYLMLDELVYAQDWDGWLKTFYDEQWPVQIAATSSATAALRRRRLESGIGRWEEQHLTPYSLPEFLDLMAGSPVLEWENVAGETLGEAMQAVSSIPDTAGVFPEGRRRLLMTGGFPELLRSAANRTDDGYQYSDVDLVLLSQQVLRSDAVERTLYKDIPQSFGVDNPMMLERLLYVVADQPTGQLSPQNIAGDLDMAIPTVERYLKYLEHAFLIFMLPNYSGTEAAVQRRGRKLYFVDGAVRNAALQRGVALLEDPNEMGRLSENLVATSLRSLAAHSGVRLYHWREGKKEVDLIYDDPRGSLAFEIASSPRHSRAGLQALINRHPRFRGRCYLVAPDLPVIPADSDEQGIGSFPLDSLLVAIGAQSHQAMLRRLGAKS